MYLIIVFAILYGITGSAGAAFFLEIVLTPVLLIVWMLLQYLRSLYK